MIVSKLRCDVISHWGSKSIHEIKKRDVSDLLNLVAQRNAHASHLLLETLKTFFRWCVGRAFIDTSPAEGLSSNYREISRDRVLSGELAQIILPAREMLLPHGGIVEFLSSRTKNKADQEQEVHIVHLSEPAWRVIRRRSEGEFVFGTSYGKHFQNFAQAKPELDKRSGATGWRLHDLRRTIVSGIARLGVPPHVADKILNHQAGTISGVAAVYQCHDFIAGPLTLSGYSKPRAACTTSSRLILVHRLFLFKEDTDRAIKSHSHHLRHATSVIAVRLVDLRLRHSPHVLRPDTDHCRHADRGRLC